MNSVKTKKFKIIIISFFIILSDQITKNIAINNLDFKRSINLIPGLFKITLAKNTGAAFSLFKEHTPLLTITSLFVSTLLIIIIFKYDKFSKLNSLVLAFLLGGTIGNGLDRIFRGYVIDFIEFSHFDFPIFNIADISINIAILFYFIDILKVKIKI